MKYCLDQWQDPQGKHTRISDLCDDTKLANAVSYYSAP